MMDVCILYHSITKSQPQLPHLTLGLLLCRETRSRFQSTYFSTARWRQPVGITGSR